MHARRRLATCLSILVAGSVHGQARPTDQDAGRRTPARVEPAAEQAAQLTRIDSWLRSLVGQFRLSLEGTSVEGVADCSGIGTGSGVHCAFGFDAQGQQDRISTAMLFGVDNVDTEGPRVHRFQLNGDSTAEMSASRLRGNAVTFQVGDCPVVQHYPPVVAINGVTTTSTVLFCRRETRVLVEPDGRFVRIRQSTYERVLVCRRPTDRPCEIKEFPRPLNLTMERVQAPPAGESPTVVTQSRPIDLHSPGEELDKVLAAERQQLGNRDDIAIWLLRLAGRFRAEGTLEMGGDRRPVAGTVDCASIGRGPGLNCVIRLRAPNIDTHLNPGAFILGIDLETPTVRYTSVDDTGVGVGATGSLWGDTAVFQTPCKSSSARICTSTTRISAHPDSDSVHLRIEINMDGRVTASYDVTEVRIR